MQELIQFFINKQHSAFHYLCYVYSHFGRNGDKILLTWAIGCLPTAWWHSSNINKFAFFKDTYPWSTAFRYTWGVMTKTYKQLFVISVQYDINTENILNILLESVLRHMTILPVWNNRHQHLQIMELQKDFHTFLLPYIVDRRVPHYLLENKFVFHLHLLACK